jgi:hypothetical protein
MSRTLSTYPFVVVRVACHACKREGGYRLARLAEKFGAEIELGDLMDHIAFDCPWRRPPTARRPGKYEAKCDAYFRDLDGPPRPPDLPPEMAALRLVSGGRS